MYRLISVFIICSYLITGYATSIQNYPTPYDKGRNSSIARTGDILIETHSDLLGRLYYKVAIIKDNKIEWGQRYRYGKGSDSSVAIKENIVVEVDKSEYFDSLWYRVGLVNRDTKTISWGTSFLYGTGNSPSIAISGDLVIEAHQVTETVEDCDYIEYCNEDGKCYDQEICTYYNNYHLYYRTGVINSNNKTIQWTQTSEWYDTGEAPSIAIAGETIVEVHQSGMSSLWYKVGTLHGDHIDWKTTDRYDFGINPSVAIEGDTLVEMHESPIYNRLWYHLGNLQNNASIQWSASQKYLQGIQPSIVMNPYSDSVIATYIIDSSKLLCIHAGTVDRNALMILWD